MGPEAVLLRLASTQYSVFSHGQALDAGIPARTIRYWVETGRWRRMYRAVYLPAGIEVGWEQRVLGACLACGPRSCASHHSAEVVWAFRDALGVPHVTVPTESARRHVGIQIHRSRRLESMSRLGFRVTTPMRTLLDLAPHRPDLTIESYVDDAHRRRLIAISRFQRYLADPAHASRPGAAMLRRILADRDPNAPIGSYLETMFFGALRRFGLPPAVAQHPVRTRHGKRYIDFAYPEHMLAIELDGYADRANRDAFENDRARQNDLEDLGWRVRRFTKRMLESDPADVAITVGRALGLSPRRWTA